VRLSLRIDPKMCLCWLVCVTFDGSKMRNSSTKSNCHRRMNRHPVGSSVGTSSEGVWALSCSLLENFAPSDEPTPSRLLTIGSSDAEEIFSSSQTCAQLLRRVVISGCRTIRCPLSPKSRSAPTVRLSLVFLHRRFIRRYTDVLVPPVITVRRDSSQSLTLTLHRRRPTPDAAAFVLTSGDSFDARVLSYPPNLHQSFVLVAGRPGHPSELILHRRRRRTLASVCPPPRIPAVRLRLGSPASSRRSARISPSSAAARRHPISHCGEGFALSLHWCTVSVH
jgi:hypothetical protein